jgi:streptogramin lyase
VITVAGADESGDADGAGGPSGPARFSSPKAMVVVGASSLLVAHSSNGRIRQVDVTLPAQTVTVTTRTLTFSGEPSTLDGPEGLAVAATGEIFVSDQYNQRIRKLAQGSVSTVAGDGEEGRVDGQGTAARFHYPRGITLGADGALYVADYGSHAIRRMDASNSVTTVTGNESPGYVNGPVASARFAHPHDVAVGTDGALYVADGDNHAIRKIVSGTVSTLAGTGATGFADGAGASAQFADPQGVAVHADGRVFVADKGNQRIRWISTTGTVSTLAGGGPEANPRAVDGPGATARFVAPARVAITAAGLAVTDGNRLRLVFCR